MRRTCALFLATLGAALLAGCGAQPAPAGQHASAQNCYQFALSALHRHVTVTSVPRACAGLTRDQLNEAVSRAIRSAVGAAPKAAERAKAVGASRFLAGLVPSASAPARPSGLAAVARPLRVPAGLAALVAWVLTAAAGAYLLAGRLRGRSPGGAPLPVLHAVAGVTGLAVWAAFLLTGTIALAWLAVGLTFLIAGLGMAALLTGTGAPPSGIPVLVIAAHGLLATAAIMLVLLATIAAG